MCSPAEPGVPSNNAVDVELGGSQYKKPVKVDPATYDRSSVCSMIWWREGSENRRTRVGLLNDIRRPSTSPGLAFFRAEGGWVDDSLLSLSCRGSMRLALVVGMSKARTSYSWTGCRRNMKLALLEHGIRWLPGWEVMTSRSDWC